MSRRVQLKKQADVIEIVWKLDDKVERQESKLSDRNGFQLLRRGSMVEAGISYTIDIMRNRFQVLESEVCDKPELLLVGKFD